MPVCLCDCSHINHEAVLHRGSWTLAVCVVLLPVLRQLIGSQQEQRLEREREGEGEGDEGQITSIFILCADMWRR